MLAEVTNVTNQPDNIYSQLANSELPFPTIDLSDGTKVRLDQAAYGKYRQSSTATTARKCSTPIGHLLGIPGDVRRDTDHSGSG